MIENFHELLPENLRRWVVAKLNNLKEGIQSKYN